MAQEFAELSDDSLVTTNIFRWLDWARNMIGAETLLRTSRCEQMK